MKYIDADKLKKSIGNYMEDAHAALNPVDGDADYYKGKIDACKDMQEFITSIQQEQPPTEREIAEAHRYAEMIRERDKARIQQEQISALERAIVKMHTPNDIDILAELRDNLKKL